MFSVATFAQDKDKFNFGFRMGVSFADVNFPNKTDAAKQLVSPTAGFIFEIPILEYLEIRPEINFGSQGFRSKVGSLTNSTWMGYGQIPILIRGQYGSEKVRGFIQAGPQFGYGAFILTRTIDKDNDDIKNKESYNFDEVKLNQSAIGVNAFDMGIVGGAGVELPKAGHLELELRFYKGFSDLNDWGSNGRPNGVDKLTNSSLTLSLAFKI
jgi:hypothetical protein